MNDTDRRTSYPRVSRETRQLLIAALVALAVLWVLARVRFPDRPPTPNPLLQTLAPRASLADFAAEVGRVQARLAGSLFVPGAEVAGAPVAALRMRPDAALFFLPAGAHHGYEAGLAALDRATGLAVIRVPPLGTAPIPLPWAPDRLDAPRMLVVAAVVDGLITFRPVFVPFLTPRPGTAWSGPIWTLPSDEALREGSFVFTLAGELVGSVIIAGGVPALVPGDTLLSDAQRLLARGPATAGRIGVDTQAVTPRLAAATRAASGVIVTWVDPEGPAASHVMVGDVITAINDLPVDTSEQWDVRSRRLVAGDPVVLHLQQRDGPRRVELVATAMAPGEAALAPAGLGLGLRAANGLGSEVVRVEPGSAAAAAGLQAGDLITMIGTTMAPGPAQVQRAYAAAVETEPILLAVTRDGTHHVMALAR